MKEVIKERQGLYRQEFEHDNCGIGAVVNIKGKKSHDTVANALRGTQDSPTSLILTGCLSRSWE